MGCFFLEAATFQPEDFQAAENEALAYFISVSGDKAFEAITRVRERFPHSPRINAYWITTTPPTDTRTQIEQRLTAADLSTPEVTTALASRALAESEFDVREQLPARVTDTEVGVDKGHAMIEVAEIHPENDILINAGGAMPDY
jgi:hypothetical protein